MITVVDSMSYRLQRTILVKYDTTLNTKWHLRIDSAKNHHALRQRPLSLCKRPRPLRRRPLSLCQRPLTLRQRPLSLCQRPLTLRQRRFSSCWNEACANDGAMPNERRIGTLCYSPDTRTQDILFSHIYARPIGRHRQNATYTAYRCRRLSSSRSSPVPLSPPVSPLQSSDLGRCLRGRRLSAPRCHQCAAL